VPSAGSRGEGEAGQMLRRVTSGRGGARCVTIKSRRRVVGTGVDASRVNGFDGRRVSMNAGENERRGVSTSCRCGFIRKQERKKEERLIPGKVPGFF